MSQWQPEQTRNGGVCGATRAHVASPGGSATETPAAGASSKPWAKNPPGTESAPKQNSAGGSSTSNATTTANPSRSPSRASRSAGKQNTSPAAGSNRPPSTATGK